MLEIAATFEAAGLPAGFHQAAASVYERMAELKEADQPQLPDVMQRLLMDVRVQEISEPDPPNTRGVSRSETPSAPASRARIDSKRSSQRY